MNLVYWFVSNNQEQKLKNMSEENDMLTACNEIEANLKWLYQENDNKIITLLPILVNTKNKYWNILSKFDIWNSLFGYIIRFIFV